jgi:hypothetical protein
MRLEFKDHAPEHVGDDDTQQVRTKINAHKIRKIIADRQGDGPPAHGSGVLSGFDDQAFLQKTTHDPADARGAQSGVLGQFDS